jgi:signal transduction histidine kinase
VSFRTRVFLALLLTVLLPLAALAYGVRRQMERRLTIEYEARVGSMTSNIEADLARENTEIATRLSAMTVDLRQDNRFRLAALQRDPSSRQYLLDYAANTMKLSGLTMLQIQDSGGRILSSGHFRNEFDQLQPELPTLLKQAKGSITLVRTRTAESPILALARLDSFQLGGREFSVVGGTAVPPRLVESTDGSRDLVIALAHPGDTLHPDSRRRVVREVALPYLDLLSSGQKVDTARFLVSQSLSTLEGLRRTVDRWLLLATALTAVLAMLLAAWLSSRISRPLRELANKTANIDLDRLDQTFDEGGNDEIGALSRLLGAMTERLRVSSSRLREAERRAVVGDLARQINHDVKNGLAPIRNVLRHLSQVARQDPENLPAVYENRVGTLDSSVEYLETLAQHYARLSPAVEGGSCDVNAVVNQVLKNTDHDGAELQASLSERLPKISGNPLTVRRVLENLVGNAVDSVRGQSGGSVKVSTELLLDDANSARVRITVADSGPGMSRAELDRAFDDFYTTKAGGTGLGLSIVRRLTLDLHGALRVETEPGAGSRFIVELPAESSHLGLP